MEVKNHDPSVQSATLKVHMIPVGLGSEETQKKINWDLNLATEILRKLGLWRK